MTYVYKMTLTVCFTAADNSLISHTQVLIKYLHNNKAQPFISEKTNFSLNQDLNTFLILLSLYTGKLSLNLHPKSVYVHTLYLTAVFPNMRPAGIIFSYNFYSKVTVLKTKCHSTYMNVRVLLSRRYFSFSFNLQILSGHCPIRKLLHTKTCWQQSWPTLF